MACPASAEPGSHRVGLEKYYRLGGNCIHLHGEGGETHSREAVGQWLQERGLRSELFLCTQICHEGWDAVGQRAIDRVTPDAISADISADLSLLQTDWLDLVYIANPPAAEFEPVLEAIAAEIAQGRIRG